MKVATDIGGTFTDLVYLDEATGELGLAKASSTPPNEIALQTVAMRSNGRTEPPQSPVRSMNSLRWGNHHATVPRLFGRSHAPRHGEADERLVRRGGSKRSHVYLLPARSVTPDTDASSNAKAHAVAFHREPGDTPRVQDLPALAAISGSGLERV